MLRATFTIGGLDRRGWMGARMGCRMTPTGFVSMVVVVMLTIAAPGGVIGSVSSTSRQASRLVKNSSYDGGVRLGGDSNSRSSTWRKLLQARRRHAAAVGFSEPAAADEEVQGRGHFVAAFSFFSSMAKGSASPSPATPSPGHN